MFEVFASTLSLLIFVFVLVLKHHILGVLITVQVVVEVFLLDVAIYFLFDDFEDLVMVESIQISGVTTASEVFLLLVHWHVLVLVLVMHFTRSVFNC